MLVNGKNYTTIWVDETDKKTIKVIDQRKIPFEFSVLSLQKIDDYYFAIKDMVVRGAPLIGVTAAYSIYCAAFEAKETGAGINSIIEKAEYIKSARPTAVNLEVAVDKQLASIKNTGSIDEIINICFQLAEQMRIEDIETNKSIGRYGVELIEEISRRKNKETVNILTHCNAGWLATVDFGTALAPVFEAHNRGIDVHVWVDETRPRNQGAKLTAWELFHENIKHTVIPDNTGGHLMQNKMVDIVIVGTDRTSLNGDVANKIGTYLKALAAYDNNIPFYVSAPSMSIDFNLDTNERPIPIEQRNTEEIRYMDGISEGELRNFLIIPEVSPVANYAFDVTPAKYVTGLITERGICKASKDDILRLFPEKK
jgi:methylthioribose-1-phosphate isomerase